MTNPDGVSALVGELRVRAENTRDAIPMVVGARRAIMEADANLMEQAADALSRSPGVRVDRTIVSVANEVAPQLDKALNDFLNPDVPGPVRANLQAVLWDNKVGILRVLQATAALIKATP